MSRYRGSDESTHRQVPRTAVLVVNLGTPERPDTPSVRRYLAEFLSDPRVIELPRWLWKTILHGVILRVRPRRSAHAYQQIWREAGSPLLLETAALTEALAQRYPADAEAPLFRLAMRYGQPSIPTVMRELAALGMRRLLVLPLYPQYSATTTASVFDAVVDELKTWRWWPELRLIGDYLHEPGYVQALANSVREHWQQHGRGEKLLLSFHGIPRRYFLQGDPYYCQCQVTGRQLAAALELKEDEWALCFQSRVGAEPWLQPYTDRQLIAWAEQGLKRVDVLCPGFAVDCLETLEEIAQQNAEAFRAAGGEALRYIPALNHRADHVDMLAALVDRHLQDWALPVADVAARETRVAALKSSQQAWLERRR